MGKCLKRQTAIAQEILGYGGFVWCEGTLIDVFMALGRMGHSRIIMH